MSLPHRAIFSISLTLALLGATDTNITFDAMSVTATKTERSTKEVPQSVYVLDEALLDKRNSQNMQEAIFDVPGVIAQQSSGGYSARLIIRGAGLKAAYGIREIMVLKDGVPLTDPDSFTRLDFVDVDDIASIEVYKGPGSIYAVNSSGGVLYVKSKSVFEQDKQFKIALGTYWAKDAHAKYGFKLGDNDYFSFAASYRDTNNSYRDWNAFSTSQATLKHGHIFDDESTLETEFSYTNANTQLSQDLNQANYDYYLATGHANNTSGAWQKSGRYSNVYFVNTRYEKKSGSWSFKPQLFLNYWNHLHPVTGIINDSPTSYVLGTDLAMVKEGLLLPDDELVFGLTARQDRTIESQKYKYADFTTVTAYGKTKITAVTSDTKGALASTENSNSLLFGGYIQESLRPLKGLIVDIGARYDLLSFGVDGNEIYRYDYAAGNYVDGNGSYTLSAAYHLWSPKVGVTYALGDALSLYGIVASADQAPTSSEVSANKAYGNQETLKASTSLNIEMGAKWRSASLFADAALYNNEVLNEIVQVNVDSTKYYTNAGHTRRQGAELTLQYYPLSWLNVGTTAALYNYYYVNYVNAGVDYSGKRLHYIPRYIYTLYTGVETELFYAKIESQTYGPYYMDDANTETYAGYRFITNISAGVTWGSHAITANIRNLFNQYYATSAEKTVAVYSTTYTYTAAQPLTAMVSYKYSF
ncbi:MAG: hypothetical protein KU37_07480 [Sulfuricurvum sp. PC08-66]|nr:MAG: hypothetical protein KU37_07480 [Sulfuricurvum sp. PC08-66]